MSSIGASYAGAYVMQRLQKKKMERMEGEQNNSNSSAEVIKVVGGVSKIGRNKKVHPTILFAASDHSTEN